MRKRLASLAVIVAAGAMLAAGGAYSIFADTGASTGGLNTGTVKLTVSGQRPELIDFVLTGPCVQQFVDQDHTQASNNLGTVNNNGCTSKFTVQNIGSLPMELSGSTLTDSARDCFTSTYVDGVDKTQVVVPGASQVLKVTTVTSSDDVSCQLRSNTVTANLLGVEAVGLKTRALVLGSSVSGGSSSLEARTLVAHGLAVDVVSDSQWSAMTASQFARYRVIVLGDPQCRTNYLGAATANRAVWTPQVKGNVVFFGGDPSLHRTPGAVKFEDVALTYAAAKPSQTGLYFTLSCDGYSTQSLLDSIAPGTREGNGGGDDVRVSAAPAGLDSLTTADLSNWYSSTHAVFSTVGSGYRVWATVNGQAVGLYRP